MTALVDRVRELWAGCERCHLSWTRTQVVHGEGPAPARLMLVGEAPGATEDEVGRPFVGDAGTILREALAAVGLDPAEIFIANLIGCRPPGNRVPNLEELYQCRPRLHALVAAVQPEVIVLLGATALSALTGLQGIGRHRGQWKSTEWTWRMRRRAVPTMPTFHPAGLLPGRLKKPEDLQLLRADLAAARDYAGYLTPEQALATHDFDGDTCARCGFGYDDTPGSGMRYPTCEEWRSFRDGVAEARQ